jgi:hypothetical protein
VNTTKAFASYRRLRDEPLWRMLRADNGPAILALLQAQLLGEKRSLPASVLFERLEKDLETLRNQGDDLPRTPQAYVADWLAAGYLARRFPAGASEEEYELTAAAAGAIRFVNSLIDHRSTATESRLSTVIQQLARLAEETETDPETRIAVLEAERERIDREIEAVRHGQVRALPDDRALERVRETIALARELAGDFRRVRDEFDQLNRDLRERIMDSDGSRGDVLEALFAGVDVIADSEAGRTFYAFWRLLTDLEQSATLEAALDQVLGREFAQQLQVPERRFLLRLMHTLLEQGGMVHEVLQHFARSLKQFVQSREYLEQRRMNELIREAQRGALALKEQVRTTDSLGHVLALTGSRVRSIDQWSLYDPSLNAIEKGMALGESAMVDLDAVGALVAQSEIDFRSLRENIRTTLEDRSPVTIGQVIARFPAVQGLGSVVGYLALGSRHGTPVLDHCEIVAWEGDDGCHRRARIPIVYFMKEKLHEFV